MVKFYFFTTKRVSVNGSTMVKLFPLENQRTTEYVNGNNVDVDVDTSLFVQANRAARSLYTSQRVGLVFGCMVEGNTTNRVRLKKMSRNGSNFYDITDVTLVQVTADNNAVSNSYRSLMSSRNWPIVGSPSAETSEGGQENVEPQSTIQEIMASAAAAAGSVPAPETEETSEQACRRVLGEKRRVDNVLVHLLGREDRDTALRKTLTISQIIDGMKKGIVHFKFLKQNGDVREAYGTWNANLLASFGVNLNAADGTLRDNENNTPYDGGHICFYDVQRRGITGDNVRCFCSENILDMMLFIPAGQLDTVPRIHRI